MLRQIHRRAWAALLTVGAAVVLCFALGQLTPGDAYTGLELDPSVSASSLAHMRATYLGHRPLRARFAAWLDAALHGDLGTSTLSHRPVLSLLRERAGASGEVLGLGLGGAWALGLGLALLPLWLGERERWRASRGLGLGLHGASALLTAVPLGVLAILALAWAPPGWLPQGNASAPWLPAAVLALAFLPTTYLQTAHALSEISGRGFVELGRAQGLAPWRILLRHTLPNASDVIIPVISLTITQAVVELVVLEPLMGWPGLGQLSVQAAQDKDMPVLAALVLATALLVAACNAASDLGRAWLNPQSRPTGQVGERAAAVGG